MTEDERNPVRAARESRRLTQAQLATLVGISRQALGAIEAGRSIPSVDVAIKIGRALATPVELLFGADDTPLAVSNVSLAVERGARIGLAHVRGNWAAHPLGDDGLRISADAIADPNSDFHVRLARPQAVALENVALAGCAPGIGIVADRLNARTGPGRFLWLAQSSGHALASLAAGRVHVAGVHLVDEASGEANIADVRRAGCSFPVTLVTLATWEAGLVVPEGNPLSIHRVADLAREGLRIVIREPQAGAQRLLERCLRDAGIPNQPPGATLQRARGHLEVARLIQAGAADVGIATRDVAVALGLGFVPLASERFDLAFETTFRDDRRLVRLLDELATGGCRADLAALGYDVRGSGAHVIDLAA